MRTKNKPRLLNGSDLYNPVIHSDFYIYGHFDANQQLFYIGKGKDNRAWVFSSRGPKWNNKSALGYYVKILEQGIKDEAKAYDIEKQWINKHRERLSNSARGITFKSRTIKAKEKIVSRQWIKDHSREIQDFKQSHVFKCAVCNQIIEPRLPHKMHLDEPIFMAAKFHDNKIGRTCDGSNQKAIAIPIN